MHFSAKTPAAASRPLLASCLLLAALGSSALAAPARTAAPEPRVALARGAAPAALLRGASSVGRLSAAATVRAALTLPLRDPAGLSALIRQQYTLGSPQFHQFLTPAQFTARFGPTAQDYAAVAAYARAQGLTVTQTTPGRTLLGVAGPTARIESAFGVQMGLWRLPGGRVAFAPRAAPLLPRSIAARLAGVAGLNDLVRMRPQLTRRGPLAPVPVTGTGGTGTGPLGGLSPNDIKSAYDLSSVAPLYGPTAPTTSAALTGAGQSIGLFELDGFLPNDIALYVSQFALPTAVAGTAPLQTVPSLQTVLLNNFKGAPLSAGGQSEVTLDIDMVLALAPAATGVYIYEDDQLLDAAAPLTIFTRMANDTSASGKPLLQVISCSWGVEEQTQNLGDPAVTAGEDTLFQQMAAQGQSLFCASGDNGAYDAYNPLLPTLRTSPSVDNPASQPFATGVGGTTLGYAKPAGTGAVGSYVSESAWSAGTALSPEGSGGGTSALWPKPSYQVGFGASPTQRDVPDVALNADPNTGYTIYVSGVAGVYGGTSAAAPLWAAYVSLIDQQRALNGLGPLGFLNPLVYPIARGSGYAADFHDVTSGTNLFYEAGPGYDDATGLGSFVGAPLLAALSLNPNQGTGTATISGTVSASGVPVAGVTVSATAASTGTVAATATTDATGSFTLSVPSGLSLTLTVNPATATSTSSSYTAVTIAGLTLAAGQTLPEPIALQAAHTFAAGLQMISAPYDYTGAGDFASLFGLTVAQAARSPRLIQFAPLLNSYVYYPTPPADTLRLGQGYWVRFPSAASIHPAGAPAPATSAFAIALQPGWNQIGDPFPAAAPLSTATVTAGGATTALTASTAVSPTLYAYDTSTSAYVALAPATDSLQPYAGYWVFASQAATLSIAAPASAVPPPAP